MGLQFWHIPEGLIRDQNESAVEDCVEGITFHGTDTPCKEFKLMKAPIPLRDDQAQDDVEGVLFSVAQLYCCVALGGSWPVLSQEAGGPSLELSPESVLEARDYHFRIPVSDPEAPVPTTNDLDCIAEIKKKIDVYRSSSPQELGNGDHLAPEPQHIRIRNPFDVEYEGCVLRWGPAGLHTLQLPSVSQMPENSDDTSVAFYATSMIHTLLQDGTLVIVPIPTDDDTLWVSYVVGNPYYKSALEYHFRLIKPSELPPADVLLQSFVGCAERTTHEQESPVVSDTDSDTDNGENVQDNFVKISSGTGQQTLRVHVTSLLGAAAQARRSSHGGTNHRESSHCASEENSLPYSSGEGSLPLSHQVEAVGDSPPTELDGSTLISSDNAMAENELSLNRQFNSEAVPKSDGLDDDTTLIASDSSDLFSKEDPVRDNSNTEG